MPDARTERWVEHRAQVRENLIESAMRAIDIAGPTASMREIAQEAKVPKPTLYRFFTDKAELAAAIGDRLRRNIQSKLADLPPDPDMTAGEFVRSIIALYLESVAESPNTYRFITLSLAESSNVAEGEEPPHCDDNSADVAALMRRVIMALGGTAKHIDLEANMVVASAISAAQWWMDGGHTVMSMSELTEGVDRQIRAMLQSTAHYNRVHIDFEAPFSALLDPLPQQV